MWHWRSSRTPVVGTAILVFGLCSLLPSLYVLVTALADVDGLSALLLDARQRRLLLTTAALGLGSDHGRRRRRSATRRDTGEEQPCRRAAAIRAGPHCAGSAPAVHRGAGLDLPGRPQRLDERPPGRGDRARPDALSNPDVGDRSGLSPRRRAPRRGWPARRHDGARFCVASRSPWSRRRFWPHRSWCSCSPFQTSPFPGCCGVRVYTTEIFTAFAALYDFPRAMVLALPLLLLCVGIGSLASLLMHATPTVGRRPAGAASSLLGVPTVAAAAVVLVVAVAALALPVAILVNEATRRPLLVRWSSMALRQRCGTACCSPASGATLVVRSRRRSSALPVPASAPRAAGMLDTLLVTVFAIPSTIVGVGLIALWNRPGPIGAIYGTESMLVLGYVARYLPVAALVMAAAMRHVPVSHEEAAAVSGAGWLRSTWHVVLPQVRLAMAATWVLTFILAFGELGVSLLVAPPGESTLPIRVYTLIANAPSVPGGCAGADAGRHDSGSGRAVRSAGLFEVVASRDAAASVGSAAHPAVRQPPRARRALPRRGSWPARRPRRSQRLRQDDAAAGHRRTRPDGRGRNLDRRAGRSARPGRNAGPTEPAAHRVRVPGSRVVAAHDGRATARLRPRFRRNPRQPHGGRGRRPCLRWHGSSPWRAGIRTSCRAASSSAQRSRGRSSAGPSCS